MGLYDAYARGAGSVILRDASGNIAEGPGFNVFVVNDHTIATPSSGVLEGITRGSTIKIARELGVHVEERAISVNEVRAADEVFATSTAGGIMPITMVNSSAVGDGRMGRTTKQLIQVYW